MWGEKEAIQPNVLWGPKQFLEEDKRATTNVQNALVFFFFVLLKKTLILRKVLGENSEKVWKVWKSVKKCQKVPKQFCPLVVAIEFFYEIHSQFKNV